MDPARLFAAVPDAALGVTFLVTWFAPTALGAHVLRYALLTMVLEFIVIHSSAFLAGVAAGAASRRRKTISIIGMAVFYSLMLAGFAISQGEWWPIWAFWGLTANRLAGVMFGPEPDQGARQAMLTAWARSCVFYLFWVIGTTFIVWLPRFGITADAAAAAGISGTGLWVEQPHRLIVAGAGYFLCQAYAEITNNQLGIAKL